MKSKTLQAKLDGLWSVGKLRRLFDVTGMTIHLWHTRQENPLPAIVIKGDGRDAIRFVPDEVRAWARKNGVPMLEEDDAEAA